MWGPRSFCKYCKKVVETHQESYFLEALSRELISTMCDYCGHTLMNKEIPLEPDPRSAKIETLLFHAKLKLGKTHLQ